MLLLNLNISAMIELPRETIRRRVPPQRLEEASKSMGDSCGIDLGYGEIGGGSGGVKRWGEKERVALEFFGR